MEEEFTTYRCPTCGGVSHPASGCQYTATFVVCGPCTREAWVWIRQVTSSKGRRNGRPAFYDHVGVIRPILMVEPTIEPSRVILDNSHETVQVTEETG